MILIVLRRTGAAATETELTHALSGWDFERGDARAVRATGSRSGGWWEEVGGEGVSGDGRRVVTGGGWRKEDGGIMQFNGVSHSNYVKCIRNFLIVTYWEEGGGILQFNGVNHST